VGLAVGAVGGEVGVGSDGVTVVWELPGGVDVLVEFVRGDTLPGGAFLGGSDVDLIELEAALALLDPGEDPRRGADTGGLEEQTDAE